MHKIATDKQLKKVKNYAELCFLSMTGLIFVLGLFSLTRSVIAISKNAPHAKLIFIFDLTTDLCFIIYFITYIKKKTNKYWVAVSYSIYNMIIFIFTSYAYIIPIFSLPVSILFFSIASKKHKHLIIYFVLLIISYFSIIIFQKLNILKTDADATGLNSFYAVFLFLFLLSAAILGIIGLSWKNYGIQMSHELLLIRMNAQKIQFFTNAAHETRTPLTLIKNYLDIVIEKNNLGRDQDMRVVRDNVLKLETDMLNFLDSEKIERGEMSLRHDQIINLSSFLTDKLKLFNPVFKKKSFHLQSKIDQAIYIKADCQALDRVLNNLLDNTVKYTPQYGKMSVNLKARQNQIYLDITNTGAGIRVSDLENIFKPYYQLNREKNNNQGLGMGLYIVKNIIESLKGEIKITSSQGKPTCVQIKLPGHDLQKADTIASYEQEQASDFPVLNLEQKKTDPMQKNILLVEDDLNLIRIMYETLKQDYNVYYALHGEEALQKLDQSRIDLIVSDVMMSVMDGYQLIKKIPSHQSHIPFLFVTARTTQKDKLQGLAHGAVDFIFKPFTMAELKLKIKNHLQNLNQHEQLMLRDFSDNMDAYHEISPVEVFESLCDQYGLTDIEKKIILWLREGYDQKDLIEKLGLSANTIHAHITRIYRKTDVNNRMQLFKRLRFFV